MDTCLYLALFVTALGSIPPCCSLQYFYVNFSMNWTNAQRHCREHFTDLVTIDNPVHNEEVKKMIKADSWIGLFNITWVWSLHNEPVGQTFWDKDNNPQPDNQAGTEDCVMMNVDMKWHDENCNIPHPFVCSDDEQPQHLFVPNESMSWAAAKNYCQHHYTDLASVRNDTEQLNNTNLLTSALNPLNNLWIGNSEHYVWIGLHRLLNWTWSDENNSTYRNWSVGEPNGGGQTHEACVEMYQSSGKWNDVACSVERPFVCYEDELFLIDMNLTWFEALAYCRSHYTDLVSVLTERVQYGVSRRAQQASSPYVWIGLRYTCTLDYWFWVSGNSTCYQNWAPGNGTGWEECGRTGAVQRDGGNQWLSRNQMDTFNFICSNSTVRF